MVRACHRILGDLHEAEDAAQEAFVTAYRSLASWRGEGPFGAWLTRIAVRIALRQVGQRRSVTWLDPTRTGSGRRRSTPVQRPRMRWRSTSVRRTDPAMLALRGERETELRIAVATLPEPYREVVTLRFFGELSLEEIARQTERPLADRQDPPSPRPAPPARDGRTPGSTHERADRPFDPAELRVPGEPDPSARRIGRSDDGGSRARGARGRAPGSGRPRGSRTG